MRLFCVIIVPLIWEGVNVLTSPVVVKNTDIHIDSMTQKRPIIDGKRAMSNDHKQSEATTETFLESVVVAINTGNLQETDAIDRAKKADMVDHFVKTLGDLVKGSIENPANTKRALDKAKEYDIKPELVQMRGEKPSLVLNFNSDAVVNGLKDVLRSKFAQRFVDKMSKEAGFLFPQVDE